MSVQTLIEECANKKNIHLDLSGKQLTEIPEEIASLDHLRELNIDNNKIKILNGKLPITLEKLSASNNEIVDLEWGDVIPSITHLNLSNNYLQSNALSSLASTIIELDISYNRIRSIEHLASLYYLIKLIAHDNNISEIPTGLSTSMVYIDVSCNLISHISSWPFSLEEINISNNRLNQIKYVPNRLRIFKAFKNEITQIYGMGNSIKVVDLSHNKLVEYPKGLLSATSVDVSHNQLYAIPRSLLATTLKNFDCSFNKLKKISNLGYIDICNTKGNEELIEENESDTESDTSTTSTEPINMEDFWKDSNKNTALTVYQEKKEDELSKSKDNSEEEGEEEEIKFPGQGHKLADLTSKTVNYGGAPPPYKAIAKIWNPYTMQWEEKESSTYKGHNSSGNGNGGYTFNNN